MDECAGLEIKTLLLMTVLGPSGRIISSLRSQQLNGDSGPEFCSILNKTIRGDDPVDMVSDVIRDL